MAEAAEPFGDHLWYVVNIDSGLSTKISRPYFGTENYLRFSYARSNIDLDRKKVETRLRHRLMFMINSLESACESMEMARVKRHLEALGKLFAMLTKLPRENVDLNRLLRDWFGELVQLESDLVMFNDPAERRRLEQACATP